MIARVFRYAAAKLGLVSIVSERTLNSRCSDGRPASLFHSRTKPHSISEHRSSPSPDRCTTGARTLGRIIVPARALSSNAMRVTPKRCWMNGAGTSRS